ncbi:MAG TPA: SRPBCC domain-containing protein [Pseudonocardiaceae bacterium]
MTEDLTSIKVDQFFPHPPELVWRVLTTSELMARWLMPNDFKPVVGHAFNFHGKPVPGADFSGTGASEVLAIEEPSLLRITWKDAAKPDGPETIVTWRLEAEGRGTRMFLEHTGFNPDNAMQQTMRKIMGGGWRGIVTRGLGSLLDEIAGVEVK